MALKSSARNSTHNFYSCSIGHCKSCVQAETSVYFLWLFSPYLHSRNHMLKEQPLSETCSTSLFSSLFVSLKLKSCGKERFTLRALWHLRSDSWENSKLPKKMKTVSPCSFHMYHLNSSVISSFELSRSFQCFKKNFSLMGSFDGFSETSFCSVLHLLFLDVNRHMSVLVSVLISLQHHRNLVAHLQVFPAKVPSNPTEMKKTQSSYLTCRSFAHSGKTFDSSCPDKFWEQETNFLKTAYYIFFVSFLANFSLLIRYI